MYGQTLQTMDGSQTNTVTNSMQDRDKNTSKEVVISTWQSIYKLDKKYFSQFGAVFVDECHHSKS